MQLLHAWDNFSSLVTIVFHRLQNWSIDCLSPLTAGTASLHTMREHFSTMGACTAPLGTMGAGTAPGDHGSSSSWKSLLGQFQVVLKSSAIASYFENLRGNQSNGSSLYNLRSLLDFCDQQFKGTFNVSDTRVLLDSL